jgi:lactoylglutathione lyase
MESQMLPIESVNHIGIRVSDRRRSESFYRTLGFEPKSDTGFDEGHPIVMVHPSGVVLNLLGPASVVGQGNVLMDVDDKHPGITHFALTVSSIEASKAFMQEHDIEITGSFSFGNMSAVFMRDPDRNVIELDAYGDADGKGAGGYLEHP